MNNLPENIRAAFRDLMNAEPTRVQAVGGGMVNHAARVEVNGTPYFVKWNAQALPGLFEVEARGLALLRATETFRIPQVIAHGETSGHLPAFLILEWIDSASSVDQRQYGRRFGQALAALHRVSGDAFGLDHDNYIGQAPQRNTPTDRWSVFYRDQRLIPQMEIARGRGRLPPYREALLNDLLDQVERILDESDNPPSLIHGDLWAGNFFAAAGGQPALVDPAVYYGDREVEIAFAELFGGASFFLGAYNDAYPLDEGYEDRRPLLQLYPMLVHLNHFGEPYGSGVDTICHYYLGTPTI